MLTAYFKRQTTCATYYAGQPDRILMSSPIG